MYDFIFAYSSKTVMIEKRFKKNILNHRKTLKNKDLLLIFGLTIAISGKIITGNCLIYRSRSRKRIDSVYIFFFGGIEMFDRLK